MLRHAARVLWLPLAIAIAASVGWLGLLATGHRTLVVMSGSMSPALGSGDVAVVETVSPADVEPGDIISFRDPTRGRTLVTHRAVIVQPIGQAVAFVTKGDQNTGVEEWVVDADGTVGRLAVRIPAVGRVLMWLGAPMVRVVMIAAAFLVVGGLLVRLALDSGSAWVHRPAIIAGAALLGLVLGGGVVPRTLGALSASTSNTGNTFQAASSFCTAGTQTVYATADAWVDEESPTQNNGTGIELFVKAGVPKDRRVLVTFTLPSLGWCSLTSATLQLYQQASQGTRVIEAWRVSGAWAENTVTWANQPATSGTPVTTTNGLGSRTWNVTTIVQAMYSGTNNGFLLKDQLEGSGPDAQTYASRETAFVPALSVTYG